MGPFKFFFFIESFFIAPLTSISFNASSLNDLQNSNFISVGQSLRLPQSQSERIIKDEYIYTVVSGDTLSKISKMTGKSIKDIMQKNRITNPNKISVGQRLSI